MRVVPLLAVALIATPSAHAALVEAPPLPLRGDRFCVDVTDTPGEIVVPTRTGVRFVLATPTGLQPGPAVTLGEDFRCEAIATRPSGAGVIAGVVNGALVVSVRDPGGAWGAPLTVAAAGRETSRDEFAAAVSERGDAIVAWEEHKFGEVGSPKGFRVARRAPGAGFGPVETIGAPSPRLDSIVPGIAATGEAFVVTSSVEPSGDTVRIPFDVSVAPPGGGFGPPTRLTESTFFNTPSLDVAADGRALLALSSGTAVLVAERAPGGAFGPVTPLMALQDERGVEAVARLGADGAAVVAWQRYGETDVHVATRAAAGSFSAPIRALDGPDLRPAGFDPFYDSRAYLRAIFGPYTEGRSTSGENDMRVTLTADGRAVVAYGRPSLVGDLVAQVAAVPLAGGPAPPPAALGPVLAQDGDVLPVVLTDGTPGAIWTEDQNPNPTFVGSNDPFRVRLAAERMAVALTPPRVPRVRIGAPRDRTLSKDEPLRLPVTCSSPCELVVTHAGAGEVGFVQLPKGGRGTLPVDGAAYLAPARRGPVPLRVVTGAPGQLYPTARSLTVHIAHAPNAGIPLPRDVRARRVGDRIVVRFRSAGGDSRLPFFVTGDDSRAYDGEPLATRRVTPGARPRSYRVTLPAAGVRFVAVRAPTFRAAGSKVTVRVR